MGQGSNAFWRQVGRNSANAVFNGLGINHGSRVRVDRGTDESRNAVNNARARAIEAEGARMEADLRRAAKQDLYSLDSAVLENVDSVIAVDFSRNPDTLVRQIMELCVQLNTNSFESTNAEEKIRAKYTNAVLTKVEQGLYFLENIDPANPQYDYLFDQFKTALKRKSTSNRFINTLFWIFGLFMSSFVLTFVFESATPLREFDALGAAILVQLPFVLFFIIRKRARVYSTIAKHKKNRAMRLKLLQAKETHQAPETPVASAPARQTQVVPSTPRAAAPTIPAPDNPSEEKTFWEKMNEALWDKYGESHSILKRGFAICNVDEHKDYLIVGFNPSYPPKSTPGSFTYDLPKDKTGYWGDVNRIIKSSTRDWSKETAYLDIFSFRESNQNTANKEIICNDKMLPYVIDQVKETQKIIEKVIRPNVIIIKNKGAWAFFGKEPQFTWMGYTFEHIKMFNNFELCRITGFSETSDRINQDIFKETNLKGTVVLFANHTDVMDYPGPDMLTKWKYSNFS